MNLEQIWFFDTVTERQLVCSALYGMTTLARGAFVAVNHYAADEAYCFDGPSRCGQVGISFADRPHGMVQGDWDALLAFADKYLMGKPTALTFDKYPPGVGPNAAK